MMRVCNLLVHSLVGDGPRGRCRICGVAGVGAESPHARQAAIHITVVALKEAQQVIKGAVLEHQDNNVLDALLTCLMHLCGGTMDHREWKEGLVKAPRFKFKEYVLPGMCMDEYPMTLSITDFVRLRVQNYELLYNITELDSSWWGWEFLQRSIS